MFLRLFAFFNAEAKSVGILLNFLQPLVGRGWRGGEERRGEAAAVVGGGVAEKGTKQKKSEICQARSATRS